MSQVQKNKTINFLPSDKKNTTIAQVQTHFHRNIGKSLKQIEHFQLKMKVFDYKCHMKQHWEREYYLRLFVGFEAEQGADLCSAGVHDASTHVVFRVRVDAFQHRHAEP